MATAYRTPTFCLSCASPMVRCPHASPSAHLHPSLPKDRSLSLSPCGLSPSPIHLHLPPANEAGRNRGNRKVFCMYSGDAAIITATSWKVSVLHSELPVLVEFFATWCGPCKMVDRVIDEIAEEYAGRIKCFKLNADYYPQLADDHDIERVPTVLLFKNGEKLMSITGTMPKSVYVRAIEKSLCS